MKQQSLNFTCHCEDERSEDVAIAKSLDMNEITTLKPSVSSCNDKKQHVIAREQIYLRPSQSPNCNEITTSLVTLAPRNDRVAFTLAEVLITLAVIGVVAAITLPSFIHNVSERIHSNRQANIAQKITKSVELMIVNGDYKDIYDTESFVNHLTKYIKIAKRCDYNHVADCWPTRTIKTTMGEMYDVSNAKTGADLHVGKDNNTKNVGLVLADGASIILTFNPKAKTPSAEGGFTSSSKDLPVGDGKTKSFPYTSNATSMIDFVMDVNGSSGPNEESNQVTKTFNDIRSFKVASFDGCGGIKVDGIGCVVDLGKSYEASGTYVHNDGSTQPNYWQGAIDACEDVGMTLPDKTTLQSIYDSHTSGLPTSGWFWSSSEGNTDIARGVNFGSGIQNWIVKRSPDGILCVGK